MEGIELDPTVRVEEPGAKPRIYACRNTVNCKYCGEQWCGGKILR